VLLAFLVACRPADTTPPTLNSSIPANGAGGIAPAVKLALVFSEAMNQSSVQVSATPDTTLSAPLWSDDRTAVYTPTGGWLPGTNYTIKVEGKDLEGNALAGVKTVAFRTADPPDTTAPQTPTGVQATAGDGAFTLSWNANTEPDLAGYTVFWGLAADALVNAVFVERSTAAVPTITFKVEGVENAKPHFYAVDAQDNSGNHSPKSSTGTVIPKDQAPPTLVSSEPANNTSDLAGVPTLRFIFSEAMKTDSIQLSLCIKTDPPTSATCTAAEATAINPGTPSWSSGDTTAQFSNVPEDIFQSGKTNVLLLKAKDKAENLLETRIAFALRATPDTTPPQVTNYTPSINPNLSGSFSFTFDEPMNQQSVQTAFLSQPTITCTWTWQGNTATCKVVGFLEQLTNYKISIGIGAKDTADNPLLAPFPANFTTGDAAPRVVSFSPSGGLGSTFGVSVTSPIKLTFSESMNRASVEGAFEVKIGTQVIAGDLSWNNSGVPDSVLTFTPSAPYGYGKTVTWRLKTTAKDAGGKALAAEVSSSFQTELIFGR
jgi:hypothetical protein